MIHCNSHVLSLKHNNSEINLLLPAFDFVGAVTGQIVPLSYSVILGLALISSILVWYSIEMSLTAVNVDYSQVLPTKKFQLSLFLDCSYNRRHVTS